MNQLMPKKIAKKIALLKLKRRKTRGKLVKEKRNEYDLTQVQLALMTGVTQAAVNNLEAGKTGEMMGSHLVKTSVFLDIEPADLALEDVSEAIIVIKTIKLYGIKKEYPLTNDEIYKVADLLYRMAKLQGRIVLTQEYIEKQLPVLLPASG